MVDASFVASANSGQQGSSASRTVTVPGTVVSGDVAVLFLDRWFGSISFPAVTAPAGAVARTPQTLSSGGDAIETRIYLLRMSGQATLPFSWSGSRWSSLGAIWFRGVDPAADLATVPLNFATATNTTSAPAVAVSTVVGAGLAFTYCTGAVSNSTGATHSPPTGYTETYDVPTDEDAWRIATTAGTQTASGATITGTTPSVVITALVALPPTVAIAPKHGTAAGTVTYAGSSAGRRIAAGVAAGAVLFAAAASGTAPATVSSYWTADSPIRAPIAAGPTLDPDSAAIAAEFGTGNKLCNLIAFGVPIHVADGTETRYTLTVNNAPAWGPDPLAGHTVPLDAAWAPSPGSDASMVVVDTDGTAVEFYHYNWNSGVPECDWAGLSDTTGDVISPSIGWSTGAGISRLAGVVRLDELAAGSIEHALVFSTDMAQLQPAFRFPAIRSDGSNLSGATTPIIEGARIQLDPAYDVDGDAAMGPFEKLVAHALQTYGAYCIDNGGGRVAVIAENPDPADYTFDSGLGVYTTTDPTYNGLGVTKDFKGLANIPWTQMRVLATWDGSPPVVANHGTAAGAVDWASSATGSTRHAGSADATTAFTGAATGVVSHAGDAAGGSAWAGAATGHSDRQGTASGTTAWTGAATGHAPTVGGASGVAHGTWTAVAAATGTRTSTGTAITDLEWTTAAAGARTSLGTATSLTTWTGTAVGTSRAGIDWSGNIDASITQDSYAATTSQPSYGGTAALAYGATATTDVYAATTDRSP